ncbi:MAG: family 65 glycosyl hydrolase domain-containing protein [Bacillota bacterium]
MIDNYFNYDEWKIIEEGFNAEKNELAESIMSLGNGHMGMRGNFEEEYSGSSLQGTYIAGVYYPDKTRVGWWKNGYPEYYAKVPNATNFIAINIKINGEKLDLAKANVKKFKRELNMKKAYLDREFIILDNKDRKTKIKVRRFLSIADREIAVISYKVKALNYDGEVEFTPLLDGTIKNEDANYDEFFWEELEKDIEDYNGYLNMKTKKSNFHVTTAMKVSLNKEVKEINVNKKEKYVENKMKLDIKNGEEIELIKYVAVTTNRDYKDSEVVEKAISKVNCAYDKGKEKLFSEHVEKWEEHWDESDIEINGDIAAQQGIRFNIFQLNQTYTGHDPRLNIGPKGFTGERYGGSTYWDTEAYCLPFYLNTTDDKIAKNLLLYRYNHLEKAIENADKLDLDGALYPMVTMNGEECHNEWEITFEEIHRNAAIAYAIYNYIEYTDDTKYLADYGFEVLAQIARFWADRVNYNPRKGKYMILGVTGPNEYENNVNNNWHTNRMAVWTLEYALEVKEYLKENHNLRHDELIEKIGIKEKELAKWEDIIENMYYPYVESLGIFEQQDGYMDKELKSTAEIDNSDLPIKHNWSWDRILRSCYVKQADVLQGLYFLSDEYDLDTKKRNFDFYEPKTVHESSLSPCIYSIIASEIGYKERAYELYLRTARLDLENYNADTEDGLHITSMAGTWMSIVHGFAGMRMKNDKLSFTPYTPEEWDNYSFKINHKNRILKIHVYDDEVKISLEKGDNLEIFVFDQSYEIERDEDLIIEI